MQHLQVGAAAVLIDDQDPVDAAQRLFEARRLGRVPVVVGPGWPPATAAPLLAAASALPAAQDLFVVLTSGSSAAPRAVLRRWESWRCSFAPFEHLIGVTDDDVLWVPGTAASTLTLFAVAHALDRGLRLRTGGAWRGADPPAAIRPAEVTAVHAVPPVAARVLAAAERGLLPRLAVVITAGAQVPQALRATAERLGIRLVEYYGAAELSFVAADPDGSGLRPFPGAELEIRDRPSPQAGDLDDGWGRIWVRSPYLSEGYLPIPGSIPGSTAVDPAVAPGPWRRDAGGWASVGDRGRWAREPPGRLLLAGRTGSTASVGATTVLLDDVEAVLREVPGVADVVCAAEPAGRLGERVVAVIQPLPGADPTALLKAAAARSLPRPARPMRWVLEPELPITSAGKVDRRTIRERFRHES